MGGPLWDVFNVKGVLFCQCKWFLPDRCHKYDCCYKQLKKEVKGSAGPWRSYLLFLRRQNYDSAVHATCFC